MLEIPHMPHPVSLQSALVLSILQVRAVPWKCFSTPWYSWENPRPYACHRRRSESLVTSNTFFTAGQAPLEGCQASLKCPTTPSRSSPKISLIVPVCRYIY